MCVCIYIYIDRIYRNIIGVSFVAFGLNTKGKGLNDLCDLITYLLYTR